MWTGDSLTVIFGLAGMAAASLIGALTVSDGWRPKALWAATGLFFLLLVGWIAAPSLGPSIQAAKPIVDSLVQSGATVLVGTVSIVALMLRKQRLPAPDIAPPSHDLTAILMQVDSAISDADWEHYTPDASQIDSGMAVLGSAFTTLGKAFGMEVPSLPERSKGSLVYGVRFLRWVRPYLEANHIEEAKAAASKFLARQG